MANRCGNSGNSDRLLFFGAPKITADGDCSHEIKRHLLLGRKAMTNLDSILKSRDIALPTKVHLVKAMVLPVVMYGCESWTIKKAEHWIIDAFELWCGRRLLRVPWIARRSNQSILKEISLEYSLEGLMLNLKLQYYGHLMWRTDSLEKTLMLGKTEGRRRRGSFFLEVFLHWSLAAYLGTYQHGEFLFQYPIILPSHTVHGVLKARILKWFAIPFSSGPHSVRPLHHDQTVLGGPTRHGLVSLS